MRRISSFALTVATAVSAVALAVAVGGPAAYAQSSDCPDYPPGQCGQMQVSSTTVVPGGTVTVSGSGFAPNSTVFIEIRPDGRRLGQVTTDASGAFSLTVTIPADTEPGRYRLVAIGQDPSGAPLTLSAGITVTSGNAGGRRPTETGNEVSGSRGAQVLSGSESRSLDEDGSAGNRRTASSGSSLPRTGSSSTGELLAVAAGLLTIGSTLLVVRRRRSTSVPQA